MAKGKKAKQPATSKKNEQKKKNQQIDDRTFGLKNKNKSKKVQSYVRSVTNSVNNTGDRKLRAEEERRKKQKAEQKSRKQAMKEEANALFNEALGALNKKKTDFKAGKAEAKGRDGGDDDKKKGTSRAMKMMYQMDAKEMEERLKEDPNYVPTLEDEIESERQKKVEELKKNGTGTPVTPESFAAWQEKKRKRKGEESRKMVEQEMRKKKGGKGLAVLSGRALYEYKKDLFNVESEGGTSDNKNANGDKINSIEDVANEVQSNLFLDGDDDSLDDLDDE
mmetsp:Transcript_21419/g.51023  ORF Transcript_21419/g.51023 Transcript_21419/m.51023 type:complete len:279 (-) Transcript_21419:488-1324(-)|eukprot:CAMPEP_0197196216 /NCGR_PEP_ID=MMETSP1423-20130617/32236_1 /TAXON_ID=476441 /ORGANISM="Pseudo-nitzschia heimii, Strain UNC1101" /LENGTH=278 /DNA_ID=CAMNT_0042649995 /DNA_START=30 /DNA_END=866 /DNA_ORIENTATION=+